MPAGQRRGECPRMSPGKGSEGRLRKGPWSGNHLATGMGILEFRLDKKGN